LRGAQVAVEIVEPLPEFADPPDIVTSQWPLIGTRRRRSAATSQRHRE
jgi:hypothetical protein